jgi:hypothetical protein
MATMPGANSSLGSADASSFLREQALLCTQLARECPHAPTSHRLEAFAVELVMKAAELEKELVELR